MDFNFSDKVKALQQKVGAFMDEHGFPNEHRFFEEIEENRRKGNAWIPTRIIEDLKPKAHAAGLWNLWRPKEHGGALTNLEYAPLCEIMGHLQWEILSNVVYGDLIRQRFPDEYLSALRPHF